MKISMTICLAVLILFTACSQKNENAENFDDDTMVIKIGSCTEYTSKNTAHVSAGRANVYTKYYMKYAQTRGSGEDLGMLGSSFYSPSSTVAEINPGYFIKGKCPLSSSSSNNSSSAFSTSIGTSWSYSPVSSLASSVSSIPQSSASSQSSSAVSYKTEDFVSIDDASEGIAFDGQGFMYVNSSAKGLILKIDGLGNSTTFVSGLKTPEAIAFDKNGNLWEADLGSGNLKQFSAAGKLLQTVSGFNQPNGLAVHSNGTVFVSDSGSGDLYQVKNGVKKSIYKSSGFGNFPNGIAFNREQTVLYVVETQQYSTGAIYKIALDANAEFVSKTRITLSKSMPILDGIALDAYGSLYVSYNKKDIARVDPANGAVTVLYASQSVGNDLSWPANIAFGYGNGFDGMTLYITQIGIAVGETPTANNKKIKKMFVGVPGMILPTF